VILLNRFFVFTHRRLTEYAHSNFHLTEFTGFSFCAIQVEDFQSQNNRWFAPHVEFRACFGAKLHIKSLLSFPLEKF